MKFDLTEPCRDCPFRAQGLYFEPAEDELDYISEKLRTGAPMTCHKHRLSDTVTGEFIEHEGDQYCAGALMYMRRHLKPSKFIQQAIKDGKFNPDELRDMAHMREIETNEPTTFQVLEGFFNKMLNGNPVSKKSIEETSNKVEVLKKERLSGMQDRQLLRSKGAADDAQKDAYIIIALKARHAQLKAEMNQVEAELTLRGQREVAGAEGRDQGSPKQGT